METGEGIRLMGTDSFITIRESYIKANGKKTISQELENNIGLMELILEDIFQKGRRLQENLNGPIKVITKVSSLTISLRERENLFGMMKDSTKDSGKII